MIRTTVVGINHHLCSLRKCLRGKMHRKYKLMRYSATRRDRRPAVLVPTQRELKITQSTCRYQSPRLKQTPTPMLRTAQWVKKDWRMTNEVKILIENVHMAKQETFKIKKNICSHEKQRRHIQSILRPAEMCWSIKLSKPRIRWWLRASRAIGTQLSCPLRRCIIKLTTFIHWITHSSIRTSAMLLPFNQKVKVVDC